MRSIKIGFFRWYIKTLRKQYKRAKILHQIKKANPTVTIEDDVLIISPQNLVLGKNVLIQKGTILHCGGKRWSNYQGKIILGDDCQIGSYCILYGAGEIEMKKGSGIAMGVRIIAQRGDLTKFEGRDLSTSAIPLKFEKVVLEEGVWVGANAIILSGVTVGRGSIISPGSIVNKDVPPFKMAVAPPARIIQSTPQGHLNLEQEKEKV
jgi:acetyltransferase-like isoleucine patch superfamily enzyme